MFEMREGEEEKEEREGEMSKRKHQSNKTIKNTHPDRN